MFLVSVQASSLTGRRFYMTSLPFEQRWALCLNIMKPSTSNRNPFLPILAYKNAKWCRFTFHSSWKFLLFPILIKMKTHKAQKYESKQNSRTWKENHFCAFVVSLNKNKYKESKGEKTRVRLASHVSSYWRDLLLDLSYCPSWSLSQWRHNLFIR